MSGVPWSVGESDHRCSESNQFPASVRFTAVISRPKARATSSDVALGLRRHVICLPATGYRTKLRPFVQVEAFGKSVWLAGA